MDVFIESVLPLSVSVIAPFGSSSLGFSWYVDEDKLCCSVVLSLHLLAILVVVSPAVCVSSSESPSLSLERLRLVSGSEAKLVEVALSYWMPLTVVFWEYSELVLLGWDLPW